jgi:hypothetical protein
MAFPLIALMAPMRLAIVAWPAGWPAGWPAAWPESCARLVALKKDLSERFAPAIATTEARKVTIAALFVLLFFIRPTF